MGSSASRELTIHNNSDCSLHYNLLIDQRISGPYDDEESARDVLGKQLYVQSPKKKNLSQLSVDWNDRKHTRVSNDYTLGSQSQMNFNKQCYRNKSFIVLFLS